MIKVLRFDVVDCERKQSSKGSEYFLIHAFVDTGEKFPLKVSEFSFDGIQQGLYDVPVSLGVGRNNSIELIKDFSQAVLVKV